ncbi:unnamed protein product [Musa textilis]
MRFVARSKIPTSTRNSASRLSRPTPGARRPTPTAWPSSQLKSPSPRPRKSKQRIEAQLKGAADAYEKDRAQAALQIFSNVVSTFQWSAKSLKSKFRSGPLSLLTVGRNVAVTIDALVDMGELGTAFNRLGSLAAAIVGHLH